MDTLENMTNCSSLRQMTRLIIPSTFSSVYLVSFRFPRDILRVIETIKLFGIPSIICHLSYYLLFIVLPS